MNAPAELLQPGIYTIPAEQYHADPAPLPSLSNSLIKTLLNKTPRHAWMDHPRLNPQFQRREDESKFDLGTAAHAMLLEGVNKAKRIDAEDWRTKAAKEARDMARADGLLPMLPDQYAAAMAMHEAARDYIDSTALRGILQAGKPEQTLIWRERHAWCRARLDWLSEDREIILDYKTTAVDGPGDFMRRNIIAHGYDTQAVFYPRGMQALGHRRPRFLFLVQETAAPFLCYLVEPAESMVELATGKVTRALALWGECVGSNRWPGYSTNVHQAEAPVWALKEEEATV